MASKRQRRTDEFKTRKKKKTFRLFFILGAVLIGGGFLAFMFWALSDTIFPPDAEEAAAKRERKEVVLYFSDANERFLVPEKRLVPKGKNTAAQAEEIVKALIEGPKTGADPDDSGRRKAAGGSHHRRHGNSEFRQPLHRAAPRRDGKRSGHRLLAGEHAHPESHGDQKGPLPGRGQGCHDDQGACRSPGTHFPEQGSREADSSRRLGGPSATGREGMAALQKPKRWLQPDRTGFAHGKSEAIKNP